ncbi:hypothetical protein Tco_0739532 [Tanacetum coccineum]
MVIQNCLSDLDKIIDLGNGNEELVNERAKLLHELFDLNSKTSFDLLQKAKIRWVIEGDENSKYFHRIINKKRSQLAIRGVLAEGEWIVDPSNLDDLEKNISCEEIKKAVWECGTNKSPGPDGFTFEFFRRFWKIINEDVVAAILEFFSSGILPPGCNSLFISLIPKTQDAKDKQNVTTIVNVLKCFFLASGLKINLHKSKLMGIGIPQAKVRSAAESIGFSTLVFPFSFLGVKVGGLMSRRNSWDEVIIPYLYIKCPPSSPMGVLRILESIRWNFFNGVSNSSRKLVLIGWQKVLASKKNGGLGVLSFFAFNRALFFKWILRFISQDTSLWFRVIQAMYGKKGALDSLQDVTSRSSPWMDIIREFKWLSTKEVPLKLTYPRLFLLELDKNISIADNLRDTSLISSFRRMPRGGIEEDQVTRLRNSLDHVILSQSLDRWVWNLESSGDFSVK